MAPRKVVPAPKVARSLAGIRKSQRISNFLTALALDHSNRGREHSTKTTATYAKPSLNDDCLLEVFSFLPMKDLWYDVGMCCRKFSALADAVVKKKCRTERFTFNYSDARDTGIVSRFGGSMRNMFVFQTYRENRECDSLTWLKHCASLRTLEIQNMRLIYDSECFVAFGKLEKLTLDRCFGNQQQYEHIITACKNLKSIRLVNWWNDAPYDVLAYLATLTKVERITSHHDITKSPLSAKHLPKIAELTKLKFLCFNIGDCDQYTSYLYALSGSQSLEELVLNVNFVDSHVAQTLDRFPKLNSCEMNYECWVPTKKKRSIQKRLMSDVTKLRRKTKNFHVKEKIIIVDEDGGFSHIKLCVSLTRMRQRAMR